MQFHRGARLALASIALLAGTTVAALAFETKPYDEASFKAAQGSGEAIVVDVFAPWCPTCAAQQKVLDTLKGKPDYDKLTIFKVDFDNQPDVVKGFGARSQSTLIAYKGASETGRSVGDTSAESIEKLLQSTSK